MKKSHSIFAALFCAAAFVQAQAGKIVMDFGADFDPARVFSGNGPLSLEKLDGAVKITTEALPQGWPGYTIAFPPEARDLSAHGGVSLSVHNPEKFAQGIGFRVDNAGADGAKFCNTDGCVLAPGETRTLPVWFGVTDGKPGFPLDPAAVAGVCVFWNQPARKGSLVLRGIRTVEPHPLFPPMAKPRERVVVDFKDPALYNLRGGAVAGGVLTGDTMAEPKRWFEFWESRAGLLAGSFTYRVKFHYRVVDAGEGAAFYALFRSHGKGWGKWDRGWTAIGGLPAKKGLALTQEFTVDLPRFKDYFMMLGIDGRAKVEISGIEITRGAPYNDGDLLERARAKRNAAAEPHVMVDFEGALPESARLGAGASVTDSPADALIGAKSMLVDTIGKGGEWNEVFTVGAGKLDAGYRYFATIPARLDKKGARGGSVYVCARAGTDGEKIGWRSWNSGEGEDDVISTAFSFREDKNFELLIGVRNEARVIFDEVEIRREPLPPDRLPLIKVRSKENSKLVFEDDFNGKEIDAKKWNVVGDMPRTGGLWRKANSFVEDGALVLEFRPDGDTYSFGCVDTSGKFNFTYGLVECRMKLPKYEGHWPGFWLFGGGVNKVGDEGRDGTEVDIMEAPWRNEDKISHCLHWDGYGDDHASQGHTPIVPGIREGWHTFAVDWQPGGYIFLVDGVETWRSDAGGVCENPLWIIFSDEMGGWSGDPRKVDQSKLPDRILVDYIRVWQ